MAESFLEPCALYGKVLNDTDRMLYNKSFAYPVAVPGISFVPFVADWELYEVIIFKKRIFDP